MRTGCPDCDRIQEFTNDKTRLCTKCEFQYLARRESQIKKRRKKIMSERTKTELKVESEVFCEHSAD